MSDELKFGMRPGSECDEREASMTRQMLYGPLLAFVLLGLLMVTKVCVMKCADSASRALFYRIGRPQAVLCFRRGAKLVNPALPRDKVGILLLRYAESHSANTLPAAR